MTALWLWAPRGNLTCSLLALKGAESLGPDPRLEHTCLHRHNLGPSCHVSLSGTGVSSTTWHPYCLLRCKEKLSCWNPLRLIVYFRQLWSFDKPSSCLLTHVLWIYLGGPFTPCHLLWQALTNTFSRGSHILGFGATYDLHCIFFFVNFFSLTTFQKVRTIFNSHVEQK